MTTEESPKTEEAKVIKSVVKKKKVKKPISATPKITRRVKKEIDLSLRKLKGIISHIRNVQQFGQDARDLKLFRAESVKESR